MLPDDLLTTTRSVRKRLDLSRPVSIDLIKDCLRVALQAPTGGNAQRWRWVVVLDNAKRAAIGELYGQAWQHYDEARAASQEAASGSDADGRARVIDSAAYLARNMGRVPAMVIACLETGSERLPAGNQASMWGSLLPAAWSYMLAARARGLGTAWTTLHLAYEREVAELLQIPGTVHQGCMIPTAHVLGDGFRPARRHPLEEVLHVDGW